MERENEPMMTNRSALPVPVTAPTRDFVHIALRRTRDTEALEHCIHNRVSNLSKRNFDVLWYEVVVAGNRHAHTTAARVTAHLESDTVVAVVGDQPGEFLAVRSVFELLDSKLTNHRRTLGRPVSAKGVALAR